MTTLLPGPALIGAGDFRAANLIQLVPCRARGVGLVVCAALAVGELALGAWMVLRELPSLDGIVFVASAIGLLVPAVVARRPSSGRRRAPAP